MVQVPEVVLVEVALVAAEAPEAEALVVVLAAVELLRLLPNYICLNMQM